MKVGLVGLRNESIWREFLVIKIQIFSRHVYSNPQRQTFNNFSQEYSSRTPFPLPHFLTALVNFVVRSGSMVKISSSGTTLVGLFLIS